MKLYYVDGKKKNEIVKNVKLHQPPFKLKIKINKIKYEFPFGGKSEYFDGFVSILHHLVFFSLNFFPFTFFALLEKC